MLNLIWPTCFYFVFNPRHQLHVIVADRCGPAWVPASPTAALGHSPNLGSCPRLCPRRWRLNRQKHNSRLSRHLSQRPRRGRNRRTIPTRTGVPSARTEGSCCAATSAPKCFTWRVTSPPSMSRPGNWPSFNALQIQR